MSLPLGVLQEFWGLVDGERAHRFVEELSRFHRIRGSKGYDRALEWIAERLREAGLRPLVFEFPLDGKTSYWTWCMPPAWDAEEGLLWVGDELVADYSKVPIHLVPGSASVEGEFEVVDVGKGESPEDYKVGVKGKVVVASGNPRLVYHEAVLNQGARGILFHYMPSPNPDIKRTPQDMPDLVSYVGIMQHIRGKAFAFSLSENQVKEVLGKGKVRVKVKAKNYEGTGKVLYLEIPGQEPTGSLVIAHLCHPSPGANDNASGAALALELALVFAAYKRPFRTIRFLWVPEMFGTVALAHERPEIFKKSFCGINLDMVGEDQSKTKGPLRIERAPLSVPCFLHVLAEELLRLGLKEKVFKVKSTWKYEAAKFKGGSDHYVLSDPTIGVPTVMFGHWPDRFYHSTEDTPDKVSPQELRIVGVLTASLLFLACFKHEFAKEVVDVLAKASEKNLRAVKKEGKLGPEELNFLWQMAKDSALAFALQQDDPYKLVSKINEDFDAIKAKLRIPEPLITVQGPVYRRRFKAPLFPHYFFENKRDKFVELVRSKAPLHVLDEAVFLLDGRRTTAEILTALRAEYGEVDEDLVLDFLTDLAELNLIALVQ